MAMGMMEMGAAVTGVEFEKEALRNNTEIRAILDSKARDSQSSGSRRAGTAPSMLTHMWLAFEIENHLYERAKRDAEVPDGKEPFAHEQFMMKYKLFNELLKNNMNHCDKLGRRLGSKQKSEYMVDQYCKSSIAAKKSRSHGTKRAKVHASSHHGGQASATAAAAAWDQFHRSQPAPSVRPPRDAVVASPVAAGTA